MKRFIIFFFLILISTSLISQIPETPEKFFGFVPGSDRMLMTYEQLVDYLKILDGQSDRLSMIEIGKSPMGKPMYVACFRRLPTWQTWMN